MKRKSLYFIIIGLFIAQMILLTLNSCGGATSDNKNTASDANDSNDSNNSNNEIADAAPAITGGKTPAPALTAKTFLAADGSRYCIAGKGEEGAKITVRGPSEFLGFTETKIIDGQFIIEIYLEKAAQDIEVQIYAQADGKEESDPLNVTIGKNEHREDKMTYIGKNNHIHYRDTLNDFFGVDLFSDRDLEKMKEGAEQLQRKLIDEGLKTKVIIFVSPNHGTIYPETMSDFLKNQKVGDDSKLKQLTDTFKNSTVKFINPYNRLMKEKENYFIYNRTDTHWNELGAYFGYCELFEYISETFPNAKPRPMSDFNIYNAIVKGGDLIPMLQFDQSVYIENAPVVRVKNPTAIDRTSDEIPYQETWYHEFHEYESKDTSKPNILMYRDSFSISMMSYMAETANKITFYNMWDYNIDINYVKQLHPDFLVIQKVERDLRVFQGVFRERNFR